MNKYQEPKEHSEMLDALQRLCRYDEMSDGIEGMLIIPTVYGADEAKKDLKFLEKSIKELVDKTMPIKHDNIVEYDEIFDEYTVGCGICNKHIYFHYKFCPHCGQALDWSDK